MFKTSLPKKAKQHSNRNWPRTDHENTKQFSLLDGPPHANAELHMSYMMNRVLKHISLLSQDALGKK
ncbi:MAG: hypothetical protein ACKESB_00420 [Candidatus Hodgkinia cicadicola]